MVTRLVPGLFAVMAAVPLVAARGERVDLAGWAPFPAQAGPTATRGDAVTIESGAWTYLVAPDDTADLRLATRLTIERAATRDGFFGATWSAWPDPRYEDGGFEAAVVLRGAADASRGYRVQVSTRYGAAALVRVGDGGYVRVVPCDIAVGRPITLAVDAAGATIVVSIDGREVIRHHDRLPPPGAGRIALAAANGARVAFDGVTIEGVDAPHAPGAEAHRPRFSSRRWLGGRWFVFDGDEPILQLHDESDPSMFAKLRPGLAPHLTFDSHWGLENQGAFKDAAVAWTAPVIDGGGDRLEARWSARHKGDRFVTRSTLTVGFDPARDAYTYDVDSELEVLPGEPFAFRQGFDFEHHTPLDPFRWRYLLMRGRDGGLTYRPLAPFDPGPLDDLATAGGLRVWHGRTGDVRPLSPAVEYDIVPAWHRVEDPAGGSTFRPLNTAVCAAFYDTGVAYPPATLAPGERLRVRYRYTGYPAAETAALFERARVEDNPRIDPDHRFVFAREQWPVIGFADSVAMDEPWWGGRPFLSGHNARPTYDLLAEEGRQVLRLGPSARALAAVGPSPVAPGRFLVAARVKSRNIHGPGGRVEVLFLARPEPTGNGYVRLDESNVLGGRTGYLGEGSGAWETRSMVVEVPEKAQGLALALGNDGTGEVLVEEITFTALGEGSGPPDTLLPEPPRSTTLPDALWDLRMEEQDGLFVHNHGSSEHRVLEIANLDWTIDERRPALRFAENPTDRRDMPRLGLLDRWLRDPRQRHNYEQAGHGACGLAGFHGGGRALPGVSLAAWVKPDAEMGQGAHPGRGDVMGYGARRFVLGLDGRQAPYRLAAWINVRDRIDSGADVEAGRWQHVAMTCRPDGGEWKVRLFLDGRPATDGRATGLPVGDDIPDSLVLGVEYFYLHTNFYRGAIGRTVVVGRALDDAEVAALAAERPE